MLAVILPGLFESRHHHTQAVSGGLRPKSQQLMEMGMK